MVIVVVWSCCIVSIVERRLRSRRKIRIRNMGISNPYHGTQFPHGYLKSNIYTKRVILPP